MPIVRVHQNLGRPFIVNYLLAKPFITIKKKMMVITYLANTLLQSSDFFLTIWAKVHKHNKTLQLINWILLSLTNLDWTRLPSPPSLIYSNFNHSSHLTKHENLIAIASYSFTVKLNLQHPIPSFLPLLEFNRVRDLIGSFGSWVRQDVDWVRQDVDSAEFISLVSLGGLKNPTDLIYLSS